jgi:hypothetical protein
MEQPPRQSFEPAGAGAVLLGTTAATAGAGTLLGWVFGNPAAGAIGGICVGIPAGVFAVYRRYRGYFT